MVLLVLSCIGAALQSTLWSSRIEAATPPQFRLANSPITPVAGAFMAWADYDLDGDLDLAFAGVGLREVQFYRNNGAGVLELVETGLPGIESGAMAWGDMDSDGDPDLLIHGLRYPTGERVGVLGRNDGGGQFKVVDLGITGRSGSAAWADFDNDGDLDLVSTGQLGGIPEAVIFRQLESGAFETVQSLEADGGPWTGRSGLNFLWTDANRDGWPDLSLFVRRQTESLEGAFLADALGGFATAPVDLGHGVLGRADFDLNGVPDEIRSTAPAPGAMIEERQVSGPNRILGGLLPPIQFRVGFVTAADWNSDGAPELLAFGEDDNSMSKAQWVQFNEQGEWVSGESAIEPLPALFLSASSADVDNDGDLDLLVTGEQGAPTFGAVSRLYLNDSPATNYPPGPPSGLRATFSSAIAVLHWSPATDSNQRGGLTYNVRIGTEPGGSDVLSPMSLSDGRRLVAQPGNAGGALRRIVSGLEKGRTYYWSVQAVDQSFIGSAFAPESTLVVGDSPALGRVEDVTLNEDESVDVPLSLTALGAGGPYHVSAVGASESLFPLGSLINSDNGLALRLKPAPDQNGNSEVTVTVEASDGGQASRSFRVTVMPVNDAPRQPSFTVPLEEDSSVEFPFQPSDPDGDGILVIPSGGPFSGRLVKTETGYRYEPAPNFFGADWCEFQLKDAFGGESRTRIEFTVRGVTDVPEVRLGAVAPSNGRLRFNLICEPYQTYLIEFSDDLVAWTGIDGFLSDDGTIDYEVDASAFPGGRFFRARVP